MRRPDRPVGEHLAPDRLAACQAGQGTLPELAHLRRCAGCQGEVAAIGRVVGLTEAWRAALAPLPEAPPLVHWEALAPRLRDRGIRVLMAMIALFGVGIGTIEIGLAAFAEAHGAEHAVALLLALWGAGSMAGGIAATRAAAPADPARRLAALLAALALLELPLALAGSLELMAVAITLFTPVNTLLALLQRAFWGRRVAASKLHSPPVFIIGHWRSGTKCGRSSTEPCGA